jgi:cysteine desulfurase
LTIYFDANATTAMLPDVRKAWEECVALGPLNASSAHSRGALGRRLLEGARDVVCEAIGADDPDNVVFTSGGTESNNIVINGMARLGARIVHSLVEHASVQEPAATADMRNLIAVGADGLVDLAELESVLSGVRRDASVLVCVQAANSETGVVQPLEQVAAICRSVEADVFLHVDASQALGRIRLTSDVADSIAFSGHKLHAPQGTGFLWLSDRMADVLPRTLLGGGQERGFRSGTQNVPGAVALAEAIERRFDDFEESVSHLRMLRDRFEAGLLASVPDASVVCAGSVRLPNTSNVMFRGADAQAVLAMLDAEDVICSNGSACSSMKPSASPVLRALGLTEKEAFNCLRFSFSIFNTKREVDAAIPLIAASVSRARAHA